MRCPAGYGDRFLAAFIDACVLFPACFVVADLIALSTESHSTGTVELRGAPAFAFSCSVFLLWVGYRIIFEMLSGATIGKQLVSIAVLQANSDICTPSQAIVRNLLCVVDFFPPILPGIFVMFILRSRQRLGDLVADTVVSVTDNSQRLRASLIGLAIGVGFTVVHFALQLTVMR